MTYLTEEQAREKRCCGPEGCGHPGPDNRRWCIASECMAWRWGESREDYEYAVTEDDLFSGGFSFVSPKGEGWERVRSGCMVENLRYGQHETFPDLTNTQTGWRRRKPTKRGYCGLAGKAQP